MPKRLERNIVVRKKFLTRRDILTDEIIEVISPNKLKVGLSGSDSFASDLEVMGVGSFALGMSGSLTRLTDGSSYLVAGTNVTITSSSNGSVTISASGGTSATPGGSDGSVQFNDGGSFGGDSGFLYDDATSELVVSGNVQQLTATIGTTGFANKSSFSTSADQVVDLSYLLPSAYATLDRQPLVSDTLGELRFADVERVVTRVRNDEGVTIPLGSPLYSRGEVGGSDLILVGIADASDPSKMPSIGIAMSSLTTTGVTKDGVAMTTGILDDPFTRTPAFSGLSVNDILYVATGSASPRLTTTPPTGSNDLIQNVGIILKTDGTTVQGMKVSAIGRTNAVPNIVAARGGLSGSLTRLFDGTSYLIAGAGISITSASNGAVTITNDGTVGDITAVNAGTGLTGGGTSGSVTLNIDDSVVATVSGTTFTGVTNHNAGLSGSLTQLTDGTSYLIEGNTNVQIVTNSNGSVSISSTDTDTTYTAGDGLDLTGTVFSADLKSGGGLQIDATEIAIDDSVVATISGTTFTGVTNHNAGLSGSLTQLTDGSSYLIEGNANIQIVTNSNGSVSISSTDTDTTYTAGTGLDLIGTTFSAKLKSGGGLQADAAGIEIDDSIVATISGSTFTGPVLFNQGLSGSLTQLTDGSSYLIAGTNVSVVTGANGAVTISSTAGGGLVGIIEITGSLSSQDYNGLSAQSPNADFILQPSGSGGLLVSPPDGTTTGGNARGQYAIDLQVTRALNTQVSSGDYSAILGGSRNTASGLNASVGGGYTNVASNSYTVVAGGDRNQATGLRSAVLGGLQNTASADRATVAGGNLNTSSNAYAFVGGGTANTASGNASVVAGGNSNQATNTWAAVGGGYSNLASGFGTTVAGGYDNTAGNASYATVGGGYQNSSGAGSTYSVIGGGRANSITSTEATIAGGWDNSVTAARGAIGGGFQNVVSAVYGTVAGGRGNTVDEQYGVVAGGYGNVVSSLYAGIGSGFFNDIDPSSTYSYIGGGNQNDISSTGTSNVIAGGTTNVLSGTYGVIGGGLSNLLSNVNASSILGGFSNQILDANQAVIVGGSENTINGPSGITRSAIVCGNNNQVAPNGIYSFIGSGINNTVSGSYSSIMGGNGNSAEGDYSVVVCGASNNSSGSYSYVGGGQSNQASSAYSLINGGQNNQVLTGFDYGAVLGGLQNEVSASYSAAAGRDSQSYFYGSIAHSSGFSSVMYDAGQHFLTARGFTTPGATSSLYLDFSSGTGTQLIVLKDLTSYTFTVKIMARNPNGESAWWVIDGGIERQAGAITTAIVGTNSVNTGNSFVAEPVPTVAVVADTTNGALDIQGTQGPTATIPVLWSASIHLVQMTA